MICKYIFISRNIGILCEDIRERNMGRERDVMKLKSNSLRMKTRIEEFEKLWESGEKARRRMSQ